MISAGNEMLKTSARLSSGCVRGVVGSLNQVQIKDVSNMYMNNPSTIINIDNITRDQSSICVISNMFSSLASDTNWGTLHCIAFQFEATKKILNYCES